MRFTLLEVVVAIGILVLSLAGLLQILTASQQKIAKNMELWEQTHLLIQAAEYALLQQENDEISVPVEIFDHEDYSPEITFEELGEQLPEELDGQQGQVPLISMKISIIRETDKKTVAETIVDRFDYEETSP